MVNFMLCVYFTTIKKLGEKMIVSRDGQDAEKAECCWPPGDVSWQSMWISTTRRPQQGCGHVAIVPQDSQQHFASAHGQ